MKRKKDGSLGALLHMLKQVNRQFHVLVITGILECVLEVLSAFVPLFLFSPLLEAVLNGDTGGFVFFGAAYFFSAGVLEFLHKCAENQRICRAREFNEQTINSVYRKISAMSYEDYRDEEVRDAYTSALEMIYYQFDYSDLIEQEIEIGKNILTCVFSLSLAVALLFSKPSAGGIWGALSSPPVCTAAFVLLMAGLFLLNRRVQKESARTRSELIKDHAKTENQLMYLQNGIVFRFRQYLTYGLFKMEGLLSRRFEENRDSTVGFFTKIRRLQTKTSTAVSVSSGLAALFSYLMTIAKILSGAVPVSMFVTYAQGIIKVHDAAFAAVSAYGTILQGAPYFDRLQSVMEMKEEGGQDTGSPERAAALQEGEAVQLDTIRFDHVFYRYPNASDYAVYDLTLEMTRDQRHVVVGENGSGKTTMIMLLLRLLTPESGTICLNGQDIRIIETGEYRKRISCMFQNGSMYPVRPAENIAFSKEWDYGRMADSLKKAGAGDEFRKKEFLSEEQEGRQFSGGEKQKFAAARTFYKEADLYIFDEPSSALDAISENRLYRQLMETGKDHFLLFVSHRMSSCAGCEDILVLHEGKLTERGNHAELMQKKGRYYDLWMAQAKTYHDTSEEETI